MRGNLFVQPPRLQQTRRVRITHAKMTSTSLPYDESVGDVAPSTRLRHLCQKRHSRPKSAKSRCSPSITLPSGGALMLAAPEGHLEVVQYLADKRCAAIDGELVRCFWRGRLRHCIIQGASETGGPSIGWTPLDIARHQGRTAAVQILMGAS